MPDSSVGLSECRPERHGNLGVLHCPHGCVTQCERERRELTPPKPPVDAVIQHTPTYQHDGTLRGQSES